MKKVTVILPEGYNNILSITTAGVMYGIMRVAAGSFDLREGCYIKFDADKGWGQGEEAAADMVEVVRCKDCKHRYDDEDFSRGHYCALRGDNGGYYCEDNDYCSYGERRSNNETD